MLCDHKHRWKTVEPLKVEDYLARLSDLATNSNCKLNLIVGEYQTRQNGMSSPSLQEFLSRFPDLSETLRNKLSGSDPSHEGTSLAPTQTFDSTELN